MRFFDVSPKLRHELKSTGVVYILEAGPTDRFTGYWQAEVDGEEAIIEVGPGWDIVDEAISWGRFRATVVVVTNSDGHTLIFE